MPKDEFLLALANKTHVVLYRNDTTGRWAFHEMNSFILTVLYGVYRELGQQIAGAQQRCSYEQAKEILEERIRLVHAQLELTRDSTGVAFLQVASPREIFGIWLVSAVSPEWARDIAEKQPRAASIH